MHSTLLAVIIVVALLVVVAALNIIMRRKGYSIPGKTVVRCSKGHLFRTTWIEGGSLQAVRLGPTTRFQHCPVGRHWAIIHPVKEADLTVEERKKLGEQT